MCWSDEAEGLQFFLSRCRFQKFSGLQKAVREKVTLGGPLASASVFYTVRGHFPTKSSHNQYHVVSGQCIHHYAVLVHHHPGSSWILIQT